MSTEETNSPAAGDVLSQAIASVRQTPIDDELVENCRRQALLLNKNRVSRPAWWTQWVAPAVVAAALAIVANIGQMIVRLPPADRELTAIESLPDGRKLGLYSDRIVEPIQHDGHLQTGSRP